MDRRRDTKAGPVGSAKSGVQRGAEPTDLRLPRMYRGHGRADGEEEAINQLPLSVWSGSVNYEALIDSWNNAAHHVWRMESWICTCVYGRRSAHCPFSQNPPLECCMQDSEDRQCAVFATRCLINLTQTSSKASHEAVKVFINGCIRLLAGFNLTIVPSTCQPSLNHHIVCLSHVTALGRRFGCGHPSPRP